MAKRIRFLIVPCIVLLSILETLLPGILSTNIFTYAAPTTADPLVLIAVDATNPSCEEVFMANINTPFESTRRIHCPAGTVMRSAIVHRSQAIAEHKSFVVLLSSQMSLALRRQVQQMMRVEGRRLLQLAMEKVNIPLTGCGQSGSDTVYNWQPDGVYPPTLTSTEQFFKTSDCQHVILEVAKVYVNYSYCPYSWNHDQYQGGWFGVPGDPTLNQGSTYSHSVDQTWDAGWSYETHVSDDVPTTKEGCAVRHGDYWCDIWLR